MEKQLEILSMFRRNDTTDSSSHLLHTRRATFENKEQDAKAGGIYHETIGDLLRTSALERLRSASARW